jgi:hypothetical protein
MEYNSVIKKNETLSFVAKWMRLKDMILTEINQHQMTKPKCGS